MKKKVFAVILTAALCVGLLPASVLAETEGASAEQEIELMSQDSAESDEETSEEGEDAGLFAVQDEDSEEVSGQEETNGEIRLLDADDADDENDDEETDEELDTLAYEGEGSGKVVINLGNGNGEYNFADYTGSRQEGDLLRYTTESLKDYAAEDGSLTINLPSEENLDNTFTVADAVGNEGEDGYLPPVTVTLGNCAAYDYALIGWVNIATGEYYDVSGGETTVDINLENENVFYADWIAASYDHGSSGDSNLRTDTVSTKDFVTMHMYDYNDLFNMYSESLEQNVEMNVGDDSHSATVPEAWTDSGKLHSSLLGSDEITNSFIFVNNGTTGYTSSRGIQKTGGMLSWPNDMIDGNIWTGTGGSPRNATTEWGITSPNSAPLNMLFDTSASSTGVHYVGEADYLFWLDEDGYYTYNSKKAAATYNQSEGRFYVYNGTQSVANTAFSCFLPYNTYGSELSALDGSVNYWFGMDMEVNFYLPSAAGTGGNLVDGKNMVFNFSGDDDIFIFMDNELVLDMSGIHDEAFGSIDFTEGTVTMGMSTDDEGNITDGETSEFDLSSGNHSLRVYYMERGGYASNLEVQFNVAPLWDYVTGDVQTVTAEKVWQDSDGNTLDPEDLKGSYAKSVEVGLFDALEPATNDTFGYTVNGTEYTVVYKDNNEVTHTYIYNTNGPTLTYIEDEDADKVVYSTVNSSGQIVDNNGYVIAWLTESTQGDGEQTLHIRIDQQTLSSENDWYYAWELLDPDGAYEVLELSEDSNYTSEIEKNNLTSYKYWSVIGDKEIEQNLENKDFTIILTDAAQQTSENIGDTKEALGWVIVGTENGIVTRQVAFSQIATLTSEEQDGTTFYEGTYGVTSQSEIEALGPGALWYVEDSEHQDDDVTGGQVEGFYLYCVLDDGNTYYLTVDENGSTLTTTTSKEERSEFYYDSLGELRVVRSGNDRVIISADGEVGLAEAEFGADTDDGRIYTYTDTATSGFAATITNTVEVVDISGEKIWDDYDNEYNTRPDSITIHLLADGIEIDSVTVTSDDDWAWSFTGLPKYNDETATEITYTITEDAVPGYTTDIDGFTVTNTLETVDIEGVKTWAGDSDDKYGTRQSITIHLLADGTEVDSKTVTSSDDWAWSFTGLPKYQSDGTTEIVYTITEDAVPGYTTEVSGYDVTNTLVTTEVSGEKTWVDEDNANNTRPESITIYLYADGVQTGDTAVVTSSDNWEWTFTDLPKYQSDGTTEIVYTIMEGETEEGHLGKYIPSYSEDGLSVTNAIPEVSKYVSDPAFGESTDDDLKEDEAENNNTLEYKMEADHIGNAQNLVLHDLLDDQLDMDTLQIVSVALYEEEGAAGTLLSEGVDYTVSTGECSADCGLDGCSFEIHVKDDDLNGLSSDAYVIVIFDIQVQEGVEDFDGNYVDEIDNFVGLSFFSYYATPDEVETYSYGFDLYKYDADTNEPLAGVEFVLSRDGDDGTVYAQFDVTDETYLLSDWADSKDEATTIVTGSDGKAIVEGLHDGTFSIEETKAPEGYQQKVGTITVTITVDENDPKNPTITATNATVSGMDVQISNTPGSDTMEIIGSKTWDDGDNADGIRPDSITIHLLADGEEVDSAIVTADDNWAWSFKDLPIYDSYGNEINYTITENGIDGYTDSVNNYNVTNTHEYETRDISGSKTWDDDNDKADARPVSITVNLYQDGELYDSKIVTAADDWAWSWNDLPKNKNGEAIVYTIDEDEVEYYTPSYESGGFDITNTFVGEEGAEHPGPDKGGDVPKTGDNNNFLLWALVMLLCGLIISEVILIRRRIR